ncbi:MAG TPA: endoglucanase, partial [Caulobacteraceae bacterium]|nr:endoglucanase [Caulobacteraceae bacterium]
TTARMALARFLVGSELAYEAIGVLDMVARQNPAAMNDPEFRGLRGAARAMVGRWVEAQTDFSVPVLTGDPASALWRGYIDAKQGHFEEARRAFGEGARAVDLFAPRWRSKFAVEHARAALELGDLPAASRLITFAADQDRSPVEQLSARLVQARVFEAQGQTDRALRVYDAIARAPLDNVAAPARMRATKIRLEKGAMKPAEAVKTLDSLRWRWRGDATELEIIRTLGEIYLSQGRYREALEALRSAGTRLPDLPAAIQLQADLAAAFRALFLEGKADGLEPVQALALFYDFRELTPVGAEGDDMVRRLARRLVDVDLLAQAAELLKYQVENRLDGVAKSQVATDLAAIYLMDRKPEPALQAIWGSRTTLLPTALNAERRVLEARALAGLGRYDHALEVLGTDASAEAVDARAEILWKQKSWAAAATLLDRRLGDRWKDPTPLSPEDETRLVRAGIAYTLAGDDQGLAALSQRYDPFIARSQAPDALRVALSRDVDTITPADFARASAQADNFAGWVTAMKKKFRERTPVRSAAGAAKPAAAAPTRAAAA